MADISQMTFLNVFHWMKIYEFRLLFDQNVGSQGSDWQYSSIGSDDGWALTKRQAFIWINDRKFTDAYAALGPNELISVILTYEALKQATLFVEITMLPCCLVHV